MRLIVIIFMSLLTLIGYVNVGAKTERKETRKDVEFEQLMSDFNKTLEHNKKVQVKADQTKDKLIEVTTKQITKLSTENSELKIELNEVKVKLDSVSADTGYQFKLLPISHYQKN